MKENIMSIFMALLFLAVVFVCIYNYKIGSRWRLAMNLSTKKSDLTLSSKWIVVSCRNCSYEEIKYWANVSGWEVLVVGATKVPKGWPRSGVHFLGVDEQESLGYRISKNLPHTANSLKNIGYLYAIEQGAEWIYDTDSSILPYGLGLEQFDYTDEVSGDRFGCNHTERFSRPILFNPYRFFGKDHMWPRGFPLKYLQDHTNGPDRYCLCHKMRTAAVQHGLIHGNSDTDAIYRGIYIDTGRIVEFLDKWECVQEEISVCMILLAEEFRYQFPTRGNHTEYTVCEDIRGANCRRANVEFEAETSITAILDVLMKMPSPRQLAKSHAENRVLTDLEKSVLVITSNYPWNRTIGVLQRMYQPFFGLTIFCGPWFPEKYDDGAGEFPKMLHPFNYIHLTPTEMNKGYAAYYCLAKVKELRLTNVLGYYVMADDATFNFWNGIKPHRVMHPSGNLHHKADGWWNRPNGMEAALAARELFEQKYKFDPSVQAIWQQFERGLKLNNETTGNVSHVLTTADGWCVSDLYYIPSTGLDYYAGLMEVFFEANLFHEIAISKYLRSVPHERLNRSQFDHLYGPGGRSAWYKNYNGNLVMIHPIKLSFLGDVKQRKLFCDSVLVAFSQNLFGGDGNNATSEWNG
ncbi:hypothetical protein Y032_0004g1870 [Ancylostoma ceylanicum]|uniref:Uncharacterized protein n=1 Tax=Ancylostoma ceylanicum TaxID=53326 RepID=A0A016VW23_9BILA|nr:hypothetical protein Y032_0004g1870 [Ancylostoma ceylanicum]